MWTDAWDFYTVSYLQDSLFGCACGCIYCVFPTAMYEADSSVWDDDNTFMSCIGKKSRLHVSDEIEFRAERFT